MEGDGRETNILEVETLMLPIIWVACAAALIVPSPQPPATLKTVPAPRVI